MMGNVQEPGIVPRFCEELFSRIENNTTDMVCVSLLQVAAITCACAANSSPHHVTVVHMLFTSLLGQCMCGGLWHFVAVQFNDMTVKYL